MSPQGKQLARIQKLAISKWFYYGLIAAFLAATFSYVLYQAFALGNTLAKAFVPTLVGLIFNFSIFIVFFDIRENLEWKSVEKRVKRRLKGELFHIHLDMCALCDIGGSSHTDSEFEINGKFSAQKFTEWQLSTLINGKYSIANLKKFQSSNLHSFLSFANAISESLTRYGRFIDLSSEGHLMDIEEALSRLGFLVFEVRADKYYTEAKREQEIESIVRKIAKELQTLQISGWVWTDI